MSSDRGGTAYNPSWRKQQRLRDETAGEKAAPVDPSRGEEREDEDDDELTPELQMRLEAASHVVSVPPPGYQPPPQAEMTPALATEIKQAVSGWTDEAQRSLDRCVGRPSAARQPVQLSVMFAPATGLPPSSSATPGAPTPPSLAPAYVAVLPDDLRRLWKDTDPIALQACIDMLRLQPLVLTAQRVAPGLAPPSSHENITVQL